MCCVRDLRRPEGQEPVRGLQFSCPGGDPNKVTLGPAQRPAHLEAIRALGREDSGKGWWRRARGGQEAGRRAWVRTHLLLIKPELWTGPQPWKSHVPAGSSHPPDRDSTAPHKIHTERWEGEASLAAAPCLRDPHVPFQKPGRPYNNHPSPSTPTPTLSLYHRAGEHTRS